jgi:hypothetical protein
MHRLIRCLGLFVLSVAFIVPTITAQDKKADDTKQDKKADDTKPDEKKDAKKDVKPKAKPKIDWGTTIDAKLIAVDTKDESEFTIQLQYKYGEPNPGGQQQVLQAQQQIAAANKALAGAKNAQAVQQAMKQLFDAQVALQKAMANLVTYKDATFDIKCKAMDGMRVRHVQAQATVDETTGEFKKLTKKDLEDLRADGYPGYPTQFKTLAVGQVVRVYFPKDAKTPAYPKDKKAPPVDDKSAEANQPRVYDVIQVQILYDAPMPKGK